MSIPSTSAAHDPGVLGAAPVLAFSIPDAVRATGLSRSALYVAIRSGALRVRKAGTRTLIEAAELQRFIENLPFMGEVA